MRFALALVLIALASPAHAITVYTDRASWEAAVAGMITTETFESVPDQLVPAGSLGAIHTPRFDIVEVTSYYPMEVADGLGSDGSRGFGSIASSIDTEPQVHEIRFSSPISAFAVDIFHPAPIEVQRGDRYVLAPEQSFFGLVSDTPFTSVNIFQALRGVA